MRDCISKWLLTGFVATIAVAQQIGILWLFQAIDMSERPDPSATGIGPGGMMLYGSVLLNVVLAGAFYVFSKRMVTDAWERGLWAGIAMLLSPWAAWMLVLFVPGLISLLVGIIAPYVIIAIGLRDLRTRTT